MEIILTQDNGVIQDIINQVAQTIGINKTEAALQQEATRKEDSGIQEQLCIETELQEHRIQH